MIAVASAPPTGRARPLALVTGASAGIGAAAAMLLAARGYDVALVARRADRLERVATSLRNGHGVDAIVIPADLSLPDAHRPILAALVGRPVDLLMNNAGLTIPGDFVDAPWPRQRDCLMTMVVAVCDLTHAILPGMLAQRSGRIITISSILALSQGGPGHTLYPAAKAFAHLFMLSLDAEVRGQGVVCTSVLPGSTNSDFRDANGVALRPGSLADRFTQSAETVARAAVDGNARGRLIVIPGAHNRIAAAAMKMLPNRLVRWAGRRAG